MSTSTDYLIIFTSFAADGTRVSPHKIKHTPRPTQMQLTPAHAPVPGGVAGSTPASATSARCAGPGCPVPGGVAGSVPGGAAGAARAPARGGAAGSAPVRAGR